MTLGAAWWGWHPRLTKDESIQRLEEEGQTRKRQAGKNLQLEGVAIDEAQVWIRGVVGLGR